ncbi:DNA (cytosine-5-)-methyltransferase [Legionella worsleiensis]|uniref:Cytosine-specific methyltransferase n=2 Tax=Legionella worsleiensis TaxID=45076 RepID=A0A0W1AKP2_9GAMM|nr:DNA (cytosine-5-)-methyltransferase [Legionella worsleiensis]STY31278.1 modification methylase (Eco47II, Sau96I) [Legionella worsleiensis]
MLSLFSGCGGMDLGFEGGFSILKKSYNPLTHQHWNIKELDEHWLKLPSTGYKTIFANDILRSAKAAWTSYFSNTRAISEGTFAQESIIDVVHKIKNADLVFQQDIDIVTGGFPCQDFSVAGKRLGFNSHKGHHGDVLTDLDNPSIDNRGKLYWWMREFINLTQPKVFIAENVKGLVSLDNVKAIIESDFKDIGGGYTVVPSRVLSAYEYGVPQSRERVIFIGFRKSSLNSKAAQELEHAVISERYSPYPVKSHYWDKDNSAHIIAKLNPHVSVRDALVGLPEPEESDDLSHQSYSKAKWMGKHCQGQIEVKLDQIGPTIRSEHHGNIEFRRLALEHGGKYDDDFKKGKKQRRLSVRECARIQTFPDEFHFVRKVSDPNYKISASEGYKLVGNAVPPLLAFHIAMRLKDNWELYFG